MRLRLRNRETQGRRERNDESRRGRGSREVRTRAQRRRCPCTNLPDRSFPLKLVDLNTKAPTGGALQSPLTDSNRRPPPYHALRNDCRGVATGCGSACLSGFRGCSICHRLPPVAPAGLHKCSIPSPGSPMAKGVWASPKCASSVEPFCVERGVIGAPAIMRWLVTAMHIELEPFSVERGVELTFRARRDC